MMTVTTMQDAAENPQGVSEPSANLGVASRFTSAAVLAPTNACVAVLDVYRAVISPIYGDVCRFYPSCSRYTLTAIQQHGVMKGVALGARRLARCHPWARGGIDDVPIPRRTHAVLGRGGFVLRREPHDLTQPCPCDPTPQTIEGADPRA